MCCAVQLNYILVCALPVSLVILKYIDMYVIVELLSCECSGGKQIEPKGGKCYEWRSFAVFILVACIAVVVVASSDGDASSFIDMKYYLKYGIITI